MNEISHDYLTDIWRLSYDGEGQEESLQTLEPLTDPTSFTLVARVLTPPEQGGVGLVIQGPTEPLVLLQARSVPAPSEFYAVEFAPPPVPYFLRIEYHDDTAYMAYSPDGLLWAIIDELSLADPGIPDPVQAGLILTWDPGSGPVWGEIDTFRVLPGLWGYTGGDVTIGAIAPPIPTAMSVTVQEEPRLHALIGAQFGDLEFDVGKSVRWTQWFVDDVHITDVNVGTQRYWVVNWAGSFPEVTHNVSGINYFTANVQFRQAQFQEASSRWPLSDTDWVLFMDAHEGLSCDTVNPPDDCNFLMFKPYLYREIARATGDRVVLPFFALLRYDFVQNLQYESSALDFDGNPMVVLQSAGVPFYEPYLGLTRLVRVSALRDPTFDWASIDYPRAAADPAVKIQVISYGYAHWNLQDIPPGHTTVPELNADNDDGWRQRCLLSLVRPIPGLPVSSSWVSPVDDPQGLRGPWAPEFTGAPPMIYPPNPFPPVLDPAAAGLRTPLYHTIFRLNMRDGVWYESNQPGNTPLVWDPEAKRWVERTPASVGGIIQ